MSQRFFIPPQFPIAGYVLAIAAITLASLLHSCAKGPNVIESTAATTHIASNYRTPDDCFREIDAIWDDTFGIKTKSGLPKQKPRVDYISVITSPRTKGGHAADSVGYLINFAHDGGFAIIRADKIKAPFVAICDSGNLDEEKLLNPDLATDDDGQDVIYGLLRQTLFTQDAASETDLDKPVQTRSLTDTEWVIDDYVSPLVHVKWGQGYPFNMYMPISSNPDLGPNSSYKGRNPAGCVMIMLAQIIATTGHPQYFLLPPYYISFNTSVLSGISTYQNYTQYSPYNYDYYVTDSLSRANVDYAARMIKTIADEVNASYNSNSTSAYTDIAIQYLSSLEPSFYGDNHPQSFLDSITDRELMYLYLDSGKPLPIRGQRTGGGHAWLIDGYLNRSDISDPDNTEKLLHFNWGWQGRCDGYFTDGVLDISQRVMQDAIDTNNGSLIDRDYCYNTKFYFYGYLY